MRDQVIIYSFMSRFRGNDVSDSTSSGFSQLTEAQVLLCRNDTDGVGVSLPTAPALYTDNHFSFTENAQINGPLDTPLESAVDIFLPIRFFKVWFVLWEQEWVYAAVQM